MANTKFNCKKKWDKVFKSGLSKFCGRQPLKNFKGCRPYSFKFFKGCLPQNLLSPLLNTLSQMTMYMMCKMLNQMLGTQTRIQNPVDRLRRRILRQ